MWWDHLGILKDVLCPYHECPSCVMCPALVTPLPPSSRMEVEPSFVFFPHEALHLGLDKPSLQTPGTFLLR